MLILIDSNFFTFEFSPDTKSLITGIEFKDFLRIMNFKNGMRLDAKMTKNMRTTD